MARPAPSELADETIPVPGSVRFPVELTPPDGFDPARLETWPDVAGSVEWVAGRLLYMPSCGDRQQMTVADAVTIIHAPPVLAVEVEGRYEGPRALSEKARWYLDHGVSVVWLLHPTSRHVLVVTRAGESRHEMGDRLPPCPELPDLARGRRALLAGVARDARRQPLTARRARLDSMSTTSHRRLDAGGIAVALTLIAASIAGAQVTCRPNVFGGSDCRGRDGTSSSSRPNVFGGVDTTFSNGARTTSRPNVFGGEDIRTPSGTITSRPNVFGGRDYRLPRDGSITSRPNVFGGEDFQLPDGDSVHSRPNVFGGEDYRGDESLPWLPEE